MFGLLKIIIEVALVSYLPGLVLLLLFQTLNVKGLDAVRRLVKWVSLAALLIVLYLKLNSFYFSEGGIEYRRIPLKYPFEIKETESGTYIDRSPSSDNDFINNCDIKTFGIVENEIYFTSSGSADSIVSFDFSTKAFKTVSQAHQIRLESFNCQFTAYHFLKIDGVLTLIIGLIVGITAYSITKTSQAKDEQYKK